MSNLWTSSGLVSYRTQQSLRSVKPTHHFQWQKLRLINLFVTMPFHVQYMFPYKKNRLRGFQALGRDITSTRTPTSKYNCTTIPNAYKSTASRAVDIKGQTESEMSMRQRVCSGESTLQQKYKMKTKHKLSYLAHRTKEMWKPNGQ